MPSDCLECLIGATRVEVPLAEVERLLEYDTAPPPPLAEPWIGGIGVEGAGSDELFLSVSLRGEGSTRARHAQGLLFKSAEGRPRWALEVDRVVGLRAVEADAEADPVTDWACPSQWLRRARDAQGSAVRWFDVAAAVRTLIGSEEEAPPA